jgi:hypothetical protein
VTHTDIPEHDLTLRLVVTRRVKGRLTPQTQHRAVKALKRALGVRSLYRVDVCEVAGVRQVRP